MIFSLGGLCLGLDILCEVAEFTGSRRERRGSVLVDGFELAPDVGLLLALLEGLAKFLRSSMSMATPSQWEIFPDSSRTG